MKTVCILLAITFRLLSPAVWAQPGLVGEYFTGTNFEHKVLTRVDPQIAFNWRGRGPVPGVGKSYFSVRWTGKLLAPVSGRYIFSANVDDGIRVWVGNKKIIDAWALHDDESFKGSVVLEAGKYYDLRVDYFNDMLEGMIDLVWSQPNESGKIPPLVDAAGRPVGDQTTYRTIDAKFLYRTVPPPPKPVIPPPKLLAKPVAIVKPVATLLQKPVAQPPKHQPVPVAVRKPVATVTPPPAITPATPEKKSFAETFDQLETGKSLVLTSVYFEQSTCVLLTESFPELDKLVRTLHQNPAIRIEIAGHTDNVGDPRLNQSLSEYRARVVANYLNRHGIAENRVDAKGYGGSRPIVENTIESDRARNRRVEFTIK